VWCEVTCAEEIASLPNRDKTRRYERGGRGESPAFFFLVHLFLGRRETVVFLQVFCTINHML